MSAAAVGLLVEAGFAVIEGIRIANAGEKVPPEIWATILTKIADAESNLDDALAERNQPE